MAIRRRLLMQSVSADKPIYTIQNYQCERNALDTGIYLYQTGSKGYTILLESDFSNFTANNAPLLLKMGYYFGQWYIQSDALYGYNGSQTNIITKTNNDKTWLQSIAYSFNADTMLITAFWNGETAVTKTIPALIDSNATLKINPENRFDLTTVLIKSLRIYDYPMTEVEMREKLS